VLVALGSSVTEHEELARGAAAAFRADLLNAVEATAHRVLLGLGRRDREH
jgi:hypothetical protein